MTLRDLPTFALMALGIPWVWKTLLFLLVFIAASALFVLGGCTYNDSHVSDWPRAHPELLRHQFQYPD